RAGCAAAECHGGATGRGGFKLSLFATNPRADYEAITQELGGRRVDFANPPQSLVLRKPTRLMKHKGGRVIEPDSEFHRAVESWIRDGAPFSRGEGGELTELEMTVRKTSSGGRSFVNAVFRRANRDSQVRDVTRLARFESTDERVASVNQDGLVSIAGPGQAWIIARYGTLSARFPILEPFGGVAGPSVAEAGAPGHPWRKELAELGIGPVPEAGPYRLLRRLYIDLTGRPPAPNEIAGFLKHPPSERVSRTAQELLASDEFSARLARHLWEWFEVPLPEDDLTHTGERNARLREEVR
ncbi:MAG: DUF1549 domain-containing protein, partial [Akkermansiaceae bacterium]|nr:DUF1549 domain-containing protein [Akkermansiaceae bacterium]